MEYKVNFRNQLVAMDGIIRFTIFLLIGTWYIGYIKEFSKDTYLLICSLYLVNLIVVLFIHFQYLYNSRNIIILKNPFTEKIIYDSSGLSRTINFEDIEKIEVHMVPSMYRGSNFKMLPFEPYHYAIIITKAANYVITCLVMPNIMEEFDKLGIKYTKKRRFFPYIRKEYN
jgi:hypothetical protein